MQLRFAPAALVLSLAADPIVFAASADPGVDAFALAPAGQWLGCNISPRGVHTAVLMPKGQQQCVWLDGVEGPAFDELIPFDGRPYTAGAPLSTTLRIPVAFSEDGEHHAYLAKVGADYVLYRDGREVARGKHGARLAGLAFSAGAHHLYFSESDPTLGTALVMDGKPGPRLQDPPKLVFSTNGKRFAYAARLKGQPKPTLFVDGEQAAYAGEDPQFTRDGKTLVTLLKAQNNHVVQLDGKPLFRARHVFKVYLSPYGDQIISSVANDGAMGSHLQLHDKAIPNSQCGAVRNVFFSPDGKRYAALCSDHGFTKNLNQTNLGEFIFLDGKRGTTYRRIRDSADASQDQQRQMWLSGGWVRRTEPAVTVPGFTSDSQRFVYMPSRDQEEFVVANEEVSEAYPLGRVLSPVIGGGGKRMAYLFLDPVRKVVVDGQSRDLTHVPYSLSFSPDGTRVAYVHATLCLDGQDLPLAADRSPRYLFSPDSKTFAYFGLKSGSVRGLYLDGELAIAGAEYAERPVFTADSKHLFWYGKHGEPAAVQEPLAAYVDGRMAVRFRELINTRDNWELSGAGVLTFVARTGDALKRFRITPSAASGVSAMKAAAKSGGAPKLADLAAAPVIPVASAASESSGVAQAAVTPPPSSSSPPPPAATPVPPATPSPTPTTDRVTGAAKKATDAIEATGNKAKAWLDSLGKKKN